MNERHAREARIFSRYAGFIFKPGDIVITRTLDERGTIPRRHQRAFATLSHRQRGQITRMWRVGVARWLKSRGVTPKGDAAVARAQAAA